MSIISASATFFAALGILAQPVCGETHWHGAKSAHFFIFHERQALPSSYTLGLERLHSKLRLHMGLFAPWLTGEKISIYIYASEKTYKTGEFSPPGWSKGIALPKRRIVAVYENSDSEDFMQTLAHELTHLLFGAYFGEKKTKTLDWLDEGAAMLMEDLAGESKNGGWLGSMKNKRAWTPVSLQDMQRSAPSAYASSATARSWYVQAYSVTRYLFTKNGKLPFKVFCDSLRSGKSVEQALWGAYRFKDISSLEAAWALWLRAQRR